MKFIDERTVDQLAKSSTILQCIISILDYECSKFDFQPEIAWVSNNQALISLDAMNEAEIMDACSKVNKQFQRIDKKPTCWQQEHGKTFVKCEAVALSEYNRLT